MALNPKYVINALASFMFGELIGALCQALNLSIWGACLLLLVLLVRWLPFIGWFSDAVCER